jgi:hypothetical protein
MIHDICEWENSILRKYNEGGHSMKKYKKPVIKKVNVPKALVVEVVGS